MSEGRFRFNRADLDNEPEIEPEKPHRPRTRTEEFTVAGDKVVSKITRILREGNAMSITVKDHDGNVLFEVPMVVAGVGTLLFPSVAALGVIGVYLTNLKIVVERRV